MKTAITKNERQDKQQKQIKQQALSTTKTQCLLIFLDQNATKV